MGTNIFIPNLVSNILQDEKYPAVHVSFGDPYADMTKAPGTCETEIGMIMTGCTLLIDGETIMEDGVYTIEGLDSD